MLLKKNSGLVSFFLAIISFFCSLFGLPTYPHGDSVDMSKFELAWSDEFDGDGLDLSKWQLHNGYLADESGAAVRKGGYWSTDMCVVRDGSLHIKTEYLGDGINNNGKPGWYTGGIETNGKFEQKYGYFECRCILPKGYGLWSAFWLYCPGVCSVGNAGEDGTEIDIFESSCFDGKYPNAVTGALHYDGYGDSHRSKSVYWSRLTKNNPYEEYNTYGVEWNENGYIFYINGVEVARTDFGGVSKVPEFIILSVEVGGSDGVASDSWVGRSIEENTAAPTDFTVDYVRVYRYN